jgi:hypothetical protein
MGKTVSAVGDANESHGSILATESRAAMLSGALQSAKGPAQTLPRHYRNGLRNLDIGDRMFFIPDHISPAANGKGQIGILGNSILGVAACFEDGAFAPRTRCR